MDELLTTALGKEPDRDSPVKKLTDFEELLTVEFRQILQLTLDDLVVFTNDFVNKDVSRFLVYKALRKNDVSNLRKLQKKLYTVMSTGQRPNKNEPGYVYIGVKHIPNVAEGIFDNLHYALDHKTRMLYLKRYSTQSGSTTSHFLKKVQEYFPFKIREVVTERSISFNYLEPREQSHPFEQLCQNSEIRHCFTTFKPVFKQDNTPPSGVIWPDPEELTTEVDSVLTRFNEQYNKFLPQKYLDEKTPLQTVIEHLQKKSYERIFYSERLNRNTLSGEINQQAGRYFYSNASVDGVHNAILKHLLNTNVYSDLDGATSIQGALYRGPDEYPIYEDALAGTPPANRLPEKVFFIRDFMRITRDNEYVSGIHIEDAIQNSNFAVDFNKIVVQLNTYEASLLLPGAAGAGQARQISRFSNIAHRDAFQLIPGSNNFLGLGNEIVADGTIRTFNTQFVGKILEGITFDDIKVISTGDLQAIFASDGAFKRVKMINCEVVTTSGRNKTIIAGLLGDVRETIKVNHDDCLINTPLVLWPLRLGGGKKHFVVSFSGTGDYSYGENYSASVEDYRKTLHLSNGYPRGSKFYADFNMNKFHEKLKGKLLHALRRSSGLKRAYKQQGILSFEQNIVKINFGKGELISEVISEMLRNNEAVDVTP